MNRMEKFGEWLSKARKSLGMTQPQLAERAHVSRAYISMLERDGLHPLTGKPVTASRKVILSLARALTADPDEPLKMAGYSGLTETEASSRVEGDYWGGLEEENCDDNDPAYLTWQAFYYGVAPDMRPEMIGEVARIVRELQRRETTHGRQELPEKPT